MKDLADAMTVRAYQLWGVLVLLAVVAMLVWWRRRRRPSSENGHVYFDSDRDGWGGIETMSFHPTMSTISCEAAKWPEGNWETNVNDKVGTDTEIVCGCGAKLRAKSLDLKGFAACNAPPFDPEKFAQGPCSECGGIVIFQGGVSGWEAADEESTDG